MYVKIAIMTYYPSRIRCHFFDYLVRCYRRSKTSICYFFKMSKKVLAFSGTLCYYTLALWERYAPIAQLDRVTDYESVGRGFESLSAYQGRIIRTTFAGSDYFYTLIDSNHRIWLSGGQSVATAWRSETTSSSPFRCTNKGRLLW